MSDGLVFKDDGLAAMDSREEFWTNVVSDEDFAAFERITEQAMEFAQKNVSPERARALAVNPGAPMDEGTLAIGQYLIAMTYAADLLSDQALLLHS